MGWHGIAHAPESDLFPGAIWTWDGQKARVAGSGGSVAILQPGDDIQQALNDVGAYGVVFLSQGTYYLQNTITIPYDGQSLIGLGYVELYYYYDGTFIFYSGIKINNLNNITIENITFSFKNVTLTGISYYIIDCEQQCDYLTIKNCRFIEYPNTVNNYVYGIYNRGYGSYITIKGNIFEFLYIGIYYFLDYDASLVSRFNIIEYNVFRRYDNVAINKYGIYILDNARTYSFVIIRNNIFDYGYVNSYQSHCIFLLTNNDSIRGAFLIDGNCMQHTGDTSFAISINHDYSSDNGDFFTICGNMCHCPNAENGISTMNVEYEVVVGNTTRGTFSGSYGFEGYGTCSECVLFGNSVQNWYTVGGWISGYNT